MIEEKRNRKMTRDDVFEKLNEIFREYFEDEDIEGFAVKLENYSVSIKYVNRLTKLPWGQKMLRFYDMDGNLIEVRGI